MHSLHHQAFLMNPTSLNQWKTPQAYENNVNHNILPKKCFNKVNKVKSVKKIKKVKKYCSAGQISKKVPALLVIITQKLFPYGISAPYRRTSVWGAILLLEEEESEEEKVERITTHPPLFST